MVSRLAVFFLLLSRLVLLSWELTNFPLSFVEPCRVEVNLKTRIIIFISLFIFFFLPETILWPWTCYLRVSCGNSHNYKCFCVVPILYSHYVLFTYRFKTIFYIKFIVNVCLMFNFKSHCLRSLSLNIGKSKYSSFFDGSLLQFPFAESLMVDFLKDLKVQVTRVQRMI